MPKSARREKITKADKKPNDSMSSLERITFESLQKEAKSVTLAGGGNLIVGQNEHFSVCSNKAQCPLLLLQAY